jgi:hypothetical protein
MKQVRFQEEVEYEPIQEIQEIQPVQLKTKDESVFDEIPTWTYALISAITIAIFVIWVISLVRMGHCNGRKSWLWYTSIFFFLFIPVFGKIYGIVVAILAFTILRNGGTLAGMKCPK